MRHQEIGRKVLKPFLPFLPLTKGKVIEASLSSPREPWEHPKLRTQWSGDSLHLGLVSELPVEALSLISSPLPMELKVLEHWESLVSI